LRRRHYYIDPKTGKFPPEYAHIIGVPFKLFKAGKPTRIDIPDYATLRALPERASLEIRFPNLIGYRLESDSSELKADFNAVPDYFVDTTRQPVETTLGTAVSGDRQTLRAELEAVRDQQVIYKLTKEYLQRVHDDKQRNDLRLFQQVKAIVGQWYEQKLKLKGEDDPIYRRLVIYDDPQPVVESINRGIIAHAAERERVLPILNHYNPLGSTTHVFGHTSRKTWPTHKSHVNLVVADTDTWEQIAAKTLEKIPAVESYVKNAFLGFSVPYIDKGKERGYGFVSHPIPYRAGKRIAVRVVSQFGEESTKILSL
jgi:type III restriction enzyme